MSAEMTHGPRPRNENPTKKAMKPAAETLENPKRGRKILVSATPRVLPKYCAGKKKPTWLSVSDQWFEKEGRIGPSSVVITPIRTKLAWSRIHSLRALC